MIFGRSRETVLVTRNDIRQNPDMFVRLLDQSGLFRPIADHDVAAMQRQAAIHNWGITLLENAAALQDGNRERLLKETVETILRLDIPEEALDRRGNGRR